MARAVVSLIVIQSGSRFTSGGRVLAPVVNRGEAIGILELWLGAEPDERCVAGVALVAHALAYIVIANRRTGGAGECGVGALTISARPPRKSTRANCPVTYSLR
jgi:hypothetical protein